MSYRENLIKALKAAPSDECGVIKMSTQVRDMIVDELESRPERVILRVNAWIRPRDEALARVKEDITAQLENGDRVIVIPNMCEAVFVPEGMEVANLP